MLTEGQKLKKAQHKRVHELLQQLKGEAAPLPQLQMGAMTPAARAQLEQLAEQFEYSSNRLPALGASQRWSLKWTTCTAQATLEGPGLPVAQERLYDYLRSDACREFHEAAIGRQPVVTSVDFNNAVALGIATPQGQNNLNVKVFHLPAAAASAGGDARRSRKPKTRAPGAERTTCLHIAGTSDYASLCFVVEYARRLLEQVSGLPCSIAGCKFNLIRLNFRIERRIILESCRDALREHMDCKQLVLDMPVYKGVKVSLEAPASGREWWAMFMGLGAVSFNNRKRKDKLGGLPGDVPDIFDMLDRFIVQHGHLFCK